MDGSPVRSEQVQAHLGGDATAFTHGRVRLSAATPAPAPAARAARRRRHYRSGRVRARPAEITARPAPTPPNCSCSSPPPRCAAPPPSRTTPRAPSAPPSAPAAAAAPSRRAPPAPDRRYPERLRSHVRDQIALLAPQPDRQRGTADDHLVAHRLQIRRQPQHVHRAVVVVQREQAALEHDRVVDDEPRRGFDDLAEADPGCGSRLRGRASPTCPRGCGSARWRRRTLTPGAGPGGRWHHLSFGADFIAGVRPARRWGHLIFQRRHADAAVDRGHRVGWLARHRVGKCRYPVAEQLQSAEVGTIRQWSESARSHNRVELLGVADPA